MKHYLISIIYAVWVLPTYALQSDRQAPMDIRSDHLETLLDQGMAKLSGGVKITQGSLVIGADEARIHQNAQQQVDHAVLSGHPATLQQNLDEGGIFHASAQEITYNLETSVVILKGQAVVQQPRGELQGNTIEYQISTGKLSASGTQAEDRVHLHIPASQDNPQ